MWNKSLMWNSPKMWNSQKKWNRPKEVEQAQRSTIPFSRDGTGPKRWNNHREGEREGGSWARCNAATSRGCHHTGTPSADGTLPHRRVVHDATTLQHCHAAQWSPLAATAYTLQLRCKAASLRETATDACNDLLRHCSFANNAGGKNREFD